MELFARVLRAASSALIVVANQTSDVDAEEVQTVDVVRLQRPCALTLLSRPQSVMCWPSQAATWPVHSALLMLQALELVMHICAAAFAGLTCTTLLLPVCHSPWT